MSILLRFHIYSNTEHFTFFFTSTLGLKEDLPYTALYHKHKYTPPPSRVKDNIIASPCPLNKQDDEHGFAISHDQL